MNSPEELTALIRDHLGIEVTAGDLDKSLDEIPGWDSVHLLWLHTVLERRTGRRIPMPDLLETPNLAGIYRLAAA